jgi:hypothetical protein
MSKSIRSQASQRASSKQFEGVTDSQNPRAFQDSIWPRNHPAPGYPAARERGPSSDDKVGVSSQP